MIAKLKSVLGFLNFSLPLFRIAAVSNAPWPHKLSILPLHHRQAVRRAQSRPRPFNKLLFGGFLGLLWSGRDKEDEVPAYIKHQLLKAQRALREGDHETAGEAYHRALKRLASSEYATSQAYIEARAVVLDKLANMYLEKGKLAEAEVTFKEAMKFMLSAGMQQESEAMVEVSLKLSKIYTNQKNYESAEVGFDWCVSTAEKLCKVAKTENNTALLGMCLHSKAQYHLSLGQWNKAILCLEEALKLSEEVFSESHSQVAVLHNDLATALDGGGQFGKAEHHARASLRIMSNSHTSDTDSDTKERYTRVYYNLGMILAHQGKTSDAREVLTKALNKAILLRDKPLQRHIEHVLRGL